MIGLSTFGSAFIIALGFFDTETEASSIFGIIISIAGLIGTPLGGYLIDQSDKRIKRKIAENAGKQSREISQTKSPIRAAAMIVTLFSLGGLVIMSLIYLISDKWAFMFIICVGCTMIFMTTTGKKGSIVSHPPDSVFS